MEKSLIKPNQGRNYGIPVFDDPTDNYFDMGLEIYENLFIPIGMEGTTCGFYSCCPTMEDTEPCKQIKVSQKTDWDTSMVHFNVSSAEKENRCTVHDV